MPASQGQTRASKFKESRVQEAESKEILNLEPEVHQTDEPQPITAFGDGAAPSTQTAETQVPVIGTSIKPTTTFGDEAEPNITAHRRGRKRGRIALLTFAILMLVAGAVLVAYPTVANWYNTGHATRAVGLYVGAVEDTTAAELDEIRTAAEAYNESLAAARMDFDLTDDELAAYNQQMNFGITDVMATVEIPSLGVVLPIYHGTSDDALRAGVGHMAGSSLPVGGASTHCVLVGHRGLPSARLFTDLDKLKVGDTFCVSSLGNELWYEVDQVLVVLPDELDALAIEPGQDLCTLVTCTPYGVNSHRLLVRGHRINGEGEGAIVTADAFRLNQVGVACVLSVPVLAAVGVGAYVRARHRRRP